MYLSTFLQSTPDSWSPPISVIDSLQITIVLPNSLGKESSHLQPYRLPDLTFQRNLDKTETQIKIEVALSTKISLTCMVTQHMPKS
jgi:hypothetical protein